MSNNKYFDIIILGVGPAGIQAGIHASRKKVSVAALGKPEASSLYRGHIENYCCVSGVKTGEELLNEGLAQLENFGVEVIREDCIATAMSDNGFQVTIESGAVLDTRAIIIATGVSRKGLGLKGEKELVGRGVSYCVDCDANFYRDADVVVTGDGSAAAHGTHTLSKIAGKVTLITDKLDVSDALRQELSADNVTILEGKKIKKINGTDALESVTLDDGTVINCNGLFIEKGAKGAMELAAFLGVQLDPEKFTYIVVDREQATNVPGIYAAGDICGPPFQMAKAVGEGCVAGMSAGTYVKKLLRQEKKQDDS